MAKRKAEPAVEAAAAEAEPRPEPTPVERLAALREEARAARAALEAARAAHARAEDAVAELAMIVEPEQTLAEQARAQGARTQAEAALAAVMGADPRSPLDRAMGARRAGYGAKRPLYPYLGSR
jgi:hypothetical protein